MYPIKSILIVAQFIVLILASAFSAQAAGEVDPTFNGAAYGELTNQGTVRVVSRQPDGKILIGGRFTEVHGYAASGLARLNADGTVDTTFNAPDFIGGDPNSSNRITPGGEVYAIAVQPDGKILVGGNIYITLFDNIGTQLGIRRLNADGSIDPTFFIEYSMGLISTIYDVKLQADGKILLGGSFVFLSSSTTRNLARLNSDGTRDTTFSADTSNTQIKELEIQTDGKIVAGGFSGDIFTPVPVVSRFNPDGSIDSSFSVTTSGSGTIEAVELQADGKTVVAGNYTTLNGVTQAHISRLNTDGTLDPGFDPGSGANAVINDVVIRADGKIVIVGNFSSFNGTAVQRIARLNTDGSRDDTFTINGIITDVPVYDVELLPDNRILTGLNTSTTVDPVLRFSADGVFDPSLVIKANKGGEVNRVLQQPDGKIIVAGDFIYANGVERRSIARFNPDGTLDTSFVPYFNNSSPTQIIQAMALQPDGKIIVGVWHGLVLQRLNSDGSQDTSFNTPLTSSSQIYAVTLLADGKILVGGTLSFPSLLRFARFNSDGSHDTTFNPAQPNGTVYKIINQPDGKILIGGAFSLISDIATRNGIARYNANGVLDNTFNPPDIPNVIVDMELQPDGKIVVVGSRVSRLNLNGTLDISLNPSQPVNTVKIQPDGKILIGGEFTMISGVERNGIARLNANFTLDTGFTTYAHSSVNAIQLQPDGKILIGGAFSKINGISHVRVARLLNSPVSGATLFDYDGDGQADISVFRASENRWYVFRSSDSTVVEQAFAIAGDVPVPADFDGDGKTDVAVFRPSTGDWWYLSSINNAQVFAHWGQSGDIPRPSDFDGDGKADFVIFRPAENNWYRLGSTGEVSIINFGSAADKPVTGDFDGDGKSDTAIYRPSTGTWWYRSSIDNAQIATQFGVAGDIPTAADYDGDGKTDLAVYRPSTGVWYILNSSSGSATIINFGLAEDKPAAADYDGDGRADIAVFRPDTGVWYLLRSTAGFAALQFGISTDTPTPNAFIQ